VAAHEFDRLGLGSLRHESFKVRVDHSVLCGNHSVARLLFPSGNCGLPNKCFSRNRHLEDGQCCGGTRVLLSRLDANSVKQYAMTATEPLKHIFDDGGRAAAGYKGTAGDCVTRSITIATGKPYQEVYDALRVGAQEHAAVRRDRVAKRIRDKGATPRASKIYRKYLAEIGWKFAPTMRIGSGCRVRLAKGALPMGQLIVKVSRHITAVIDGVIHDTHDPSREGTRCVNGYFTKVR
jgi:hypothetical protein